MKRGVKNGLVIGRDEAYPARSQDKAGMEVASFSSRSSGGAIQKKRERALTVRNLLR